ncbi:MAG TPA: biotin-dependent carboxyltransferase family protein [Stellaceae bacterium]|nr:biotin-dependent carboxyltransferase family protein [Stellaceae bacterium]
MTSALKVVAAGLHTTVQDLGRYGYQASGVPVSGALDAFGHRFANRLAGNADNAPTLEILFHGPTLEVQADSVRVAVAGGEAEIELLGDRPLSLGGWRSMVLHRNQVFRVSGLGDAACCYLAVEGGFAVEPCLGSASTYARGGFGGFEGRALQAGDLVPLVRDHASDRAELGLAEPPPSTREQPIRLVLGPQQDYFTDAALERLVREQFSVSKHADRMGMRLDGPTLAHRDSYNIVSDGIATGAIQVPGSGQPILLLVDHQTTGGYPKIATVIAADIPVVGRRKPGDPIRFAAVDVPEAERLRREAEAEFEVLVARLAPVKPVGGLDAARLFDMNLISGVVFDDA